MTADASRSGNTLSVDFKEAGLGNEAQVHVVLEATAQCINGGGAEREGQGRPRRSAWPRVSDDGIGCGSRASNPITRDATGDNTDVSG